MCTVFVIVFNIYTLSHCLSRCFFNATTMPCNINNLYMACNTNNINHLQCFFVARLRQRPGDVYVGNPVGYVHAVEYPESTYAERIIAVQVRLLMTFEELLCDETAEWGAEQMAAAIADVPLVVPALEAVERAVARIGG